MLCSDHIVMLCSDYIVMLCSFVSRASHMHLWTCNSDTLHGGCPQFTFSSTTKLFN